MAHEGQTEALGRIFQPPARARARARAVSECTSLEKRANLSNPHPHYLSACLLLPCAMRTHVGRCRIRTFGSCFTHSSKATTLIADHPGQLNRTDRTALHHKFGSRNDMVGYRSVPDRSTDSNWNSFHRVASRVHIAPQPPCRQADSPARPSRRCDARLDQIAYTHRSQCC